MRARRVVVPALLVLLAPVLPVAPAAAAGEDPPAQLTLYPRVGGALDGLPGDAAPADPRTVASSVTARTAPLAQPLHLDAGHPIRVHLANRTATAPGVYETVVRVRVVDRDGFPLAGPGGAPLVVAEARFDAVRIVGGPPPTGPGWSDLEVAITGPTTIAVGHRLEFFVGPGAMGATALQPERVGPAHAFAFGRDDARTSLTLPLAAPVVFADFVAAERVGGGAHPLALAGTARKVYRIDAPAAAVGAWAMPRADPFLMGQTMELYDGAGRVVARGPSIDAPLAAGTLVLRIGASGPARLPAAFVGEVLLDVDTAPRDDAASGRDAGADAATALSIEDGVHVGHLGPGDAVDVFSLDLERAQVYEVHLTMPGGAEFALNGRESSGSEIGFVGIANWARAGPALLVVSRVSGHGDYTLRVARDPGTGAAPLLAPVAQSEWVTGLAATDGGIAFTNGSGVWTWTPGAGATLAHPGSYYGLRAVADGYLTHTIGAAGNVVTKLDAEGSHPVVPGRYVQGPDASGNVYYWNWSTGLHRRLPAGETEAMVQPCFVEQGLLRCAHLLGFSPDGRTYGWRDLGEVLYEVDLTTGHHTPVFSLPGLRIGAVAFEQDGDVLIGGAHTGYVLRWSPADGTHTTIARTRDAWIQHMAATEDTLYVATFNDTTLRVTFATVDLGGAGFAGFGTTIGPLPRQDVALASIRVEPGASPTQRLVIVTVRNEGEAATPPMRLRVHQTGPSGGVNQSASTLLAPTWSVRTEGLAPGAAQEVVLVWETRAEAGEQWLRAGVDEAGFLSDEVVAEVDETDNVRFLRVALHADVPVGT